MSDLHTSHKAFLVAETRINWTGMQDALAYVGAPDWWLRADLQEASDAEVLVEFMGRLCYKAFKIGLNPNVTKIREDNSDYIANILKQKHGSVIEHAYVTFALMDVSRIFTHELVRHRVGTAYSQESQRFVRLEHFQLYIPNLTEPLRALAPERPTRLVTVKHNYGGAEYPETESYEHQPITEEEWAQDKQDEFVRMAGRITEFSELQIGNWIKSIGGLDDPKLKFYVKKELTSAMRRLIPGGVNTNIGITTNHRNLRFLLAKRTEPGVEVEMLGIMNDMADQVQTKFAHLYYDMIRDLLTHQITFSNEKI